MSMIEVLAALSPPIGCSAPAPSSRPLSTAPQFLCRTPLPMALQVEARSASSHLATRRPLVAVLSRQLNWPSASMTIDCRRQVAQMRRCVHWSSSQLANIRPTLRSSPPCCHLSCRHRHSPCWSRHGKLLESPTAPEVTLHHL